MKKNKHRYDSRQRELKIAEMENLLETLNNHCKYLIEVKKKLKNIDIAINKLEYYYMNEWMEDYDNYDRKNNYLVLRQDPIHNILQEIHEEKIKLVKNIIKKLK